MHQSFLEAIGLVKKYKRRAVVRNVSLNVRQGEVVGLLGPNGAGKTTTFYMIVGMISPNDGKVLLDGDDITSFPMYKRARMGIAYLPQETSIFRKLSVEKNILAILQLQKMSKKEQKNRLEELLESFGLKDVRKQMGYMLSGGERRRCEIARSLASNPKFILLDEPFAGIDPLAVEEIMKMILKLKDKGIGILITDHNVHETLTITDRSYILIDGEIFCSGTAEEIAQNPDVRKLYLGEAFQLERYKIS
ncbi:LPS export ABC transporter ATP-binding protein [Bacteroidetes/Chlorobi group bacterium MS-B_bin-24]|jgi:lipopolysaccharide export system ATP-binding protein|nr:MAG: LPS export ABC transporter ATP-binding protein [Bacteroidetes/Chlorobi group bacterium MS-B_bin-24]ROL60433.1 MAG: LPS export ABC transporter ATP-binding protein [Bacteroidetes/Chlorobi group bacterium MS-B_bin-24]